MHILARREGETLVLAYEDITIALHVTDIKDGQVKLGVDAPRDVNLSGYELIGEGCPDWLHQRKRENYLPYALMSMRTRALA